ncbi:MAG: Rieske 2Fe-2S domain-containing protein [bacterium]|nr:Rieske 2Fe-2S domain-containing protein [bacterium]
MSQKIKMGVLADVPPGAILEKRIMARRVAVFNDSGRLIGMESDCKHMHASLAKGDISNGTVTCPWHSWKYDLASGKCLTVDKFSLKKYDLEIEGETIYLVLP